MPQLSSWVQQRKVPLLWAISAFVFAGWLWSYLTVPYPAVFGDEFNTYALTRAKADPNYNLSDYDWVYQLRGSMHVYTSGYQAVHAREGNPLVLAQMLNALCLAASVPLVWIVSRSLLEPGLSFFLVLIYCTMPSHLLGAYFVLEPLYYLGFWALLACTLCAARGSGGWTATAGLVAGLLVNIKPHGIFVAGWSVLVIGISGFILTPTLPGARRRWQWVWWLLAFFLLQLALRWSTGGSSTSTVHGQGFYGQIFEKLIHPAAFWDALNSAWGVFRWHFGLYGLIYIPAAGLTLVGVLGLWHARRGIATFRPEDVFATSTPLLGAALLGMTLAFSGSINETTRVHGRYWSYAIVPTLIAGIYLCQNTSTQRHFLARFVPLAAILAAGWFGLVRIPAGLQIATNDCPETYWLYLGQWHPMWHRTLVYVFAAGSVLAGVWFAVRPRGALILTLVLLVSANTVANYIGLLEIRRNSLANGVQNRMDVVLQSFREELAHRAMVLVAPRAFMTGGALFGLPRIPALLERPNGSELTAADLPTNYQIVGTIGHFTVPADFAPVWSESDYAVYRRRSPPANH